MQNRRPIEDVMKQIADNLEAKGHPVPPPNRLRLIACGHINAVRQAEEASRLKMLKRMGKHD